MPEPTGWKPALPRTHRSPVQRILPSNMKTPLLILTSLAALTLGFALGFSTSPDAVGLSPQRGSEAGAASPQQAQASGESGALPANLSNNERVVRVFSALQERVELRKKHALFEALQGLTSADMAALVRHVESLSKSASAELLPALIERWFELDPASATEWITAAKPNYQLAVVWAKSDPEGAIRFALASPDWMFADTLIQHAFIKLYATDPAGRFARSQALPAGKLRDEAIYTALSGWAANDPAAAFAAFESHSFEKGRSEVLQILLQSAVSKDPAWTLAKLSELLPTLKTGVLGNDLVRNIANRVAQKDPKQALDWLGGLPGEFRDAVIVPVGKQWAQKEPLAALEWCMANGVDITRAEWNGTDTWQPAMLGVFMEKASAATFATLAALPAGQQRDSLLEAAFMESLWHTPGKDLYADGDAMAWSFYKQLPEDAQTAKAYLFGQKRAVFGDIADVSDWAQGFAPGTARSNAIAGAMFSTQQKSPEKAEAQLAKLTTPADRDAALRGIAPAQPAPAGADRALTIADPTIRRDTLEKILPKWLKADASASRAWLQRANIPEEWRQDWLLTGTAQ